MKREALFFSVATGGYGDAFRQCIESQRRYAEALGFDYCCITEARGQADLGMSAAWLKIPLMIGAIRRGYSYVVFVDADIMITEGTPSLVDEMKARPEAHIFCANGWSGRPNSGVIAVRGTEEAVVSLTRILSSAGTYLPEKYAVSWWGENGQVIRELAGNPLFGVLATSWNNTHDTERREGFVHFTGPMRAFYQFDEAEKAAWAELELRRFQEVKGSALDRPLFYAELVKNYQDIAAENACFGAFDYSWIGGSHTIGSHLITPRVALGGATRGAGPLRLHFCQDVSLTQESTNPYVDQLVRGLAFSLGVENVVTGVEPFWTLDYSGIDVLHIQWVEVLTNWKKPDQALIDAISARLDQIKKTTRIIYTLHNIELKADFDEMADVLMEVICSRADAVVHLSRASHIAFLERYGDHAWARDVRGEIIGHGSYDCYFDSVAAFDGTDWAAPNDHIYICGSIRSTQEWEMAEAVTARARAAGFPVVYAGNVSSSVLHWKQRKELEAAGDPLILRRHGRVPVDEMVAYARSARCFFLPRFGRLNSGVWYFATTFLRPSVTPGGGSLGEDQSMVGGPCYQFGDVGDAFSRIAELYSETATQRLMREQRLFAHKNKYMSWDVICGMHARLYRDSSMIKQ